MRLTISFFLIFIISTLSCFGQDWKVYYDSSKVIWQDDWQTTADLLEKTLPLLNPEHPNYKEVYIQVMSDLGVAQLNAGAIDKAIHTLEETLNIKKSTYGAYHKESLITQINLADCKIKMGKLAPAETILNEVIQNIDPNAVNNEDLFFQSHLKLAELYELMSKYQKAKSIYDDLLQHEKTETHDAMINQQLGNYYFKVGKYDQAEEFLTKAQNFYLNAKDSYKEDFIKSANKLSRLHITLGNYKKAEQLLNTVFSDTKKYTQLKKLEHANTLSNLANLYRQLGNFDKSETHYLEVLQIYQSLKRLDSREYATAINNLATFYSVIGLYENAENMYIKASKIYLKTAGYYSRPYANTLNNLAGLYRKSLDFTKSEAYYKKCLEIDAKTIGTFHPDYATTLNNLGILFTVQGKYNEAKECYQKALKIRLYTLGETHPTYTKVLNNLGLLYMMQQNLRAATPLLKKSIENHLLQINTVYPMLSEKEKESFYQTVKSEFERFNTFAVTQSSEDPSLLGFLYNTHLATKSMLLRATNKMRQNILLSNDSILIQDFERWKSIKEFLAFYYQLPHNQLAKMLTEIKALEDKANALERKISLKSTDFAKEINQKTNNWQDIQKNLKAGEAAIEIIRFRDYRIKKQDHKKHKKKNILPQYLVHGFSNKIYYAALILTQETKEHPKLVLLDNGEKLEGELYNFYLNAIKFELEDKDSYNHYWAKIQDAIPNVKKVFISPDGIYNILNINTLYNVSNQKYLLEELDIHLVTNTYEILIEKDQGSQKRDAIVFGNPNFDLLPEGRQLINDNEELPVDDPKNIDRTTKDYFGWLRALPGTKQEVLLTDSLLKANGWSSKLFQFNHATEENIKEVYNPAVLHIASHGYFNEEYILPDSLSLAFANNPLLRTGLMLSGANVTKYNRAKNITDDNNMEDGFLTAYEVMNLNLNQTNLVILSACETGLGEIKNGEGVFGLQRAFSVAGAKNIIFALRKVNDQATKLLIVDFYKRWMTSGDLRQAFKEAQVELRKTFPSPYYWGAFVLVGNS